MIHLIDWHLRFNGGNKTRAARSLGISIRTLRYHVAGYPELMRWRLARPVPIGDR